MKLEEEVFALLYLMRMETKLDLPELDGLRSRIETIEQQLRRVLDGGTR